MSPAAPGLRPVLQLALCLAAAGLAAPVACAGQARAPAIDVLAAVAPAPPPGAPTVAVYLQLRNRAARPDALLGASSDIAGEAMIHSQRLDGGVMRMRMLPRLEIAPGASLAMHAGGIHLMLADLKGVPVAGGQFRIRLRFEHAGSVDAVVQVLPLGSAP